MSLVQAAENTYTAAPTEFINKSKCDVLYISNDSSTFPPIIIEVQKVVDEKFIIRAIQYCTLVYQKYGKQPIIVIFGISSITMPILSLTTTSTLFPFAKELSSLVWARRCMLISSFSLDIIDKKMNQLHPLAAIGVFMCSQATSINMLELGREDDLMQLLYRIALKSIEQVAGAEAEKEQQILSICDNVGHKLQKIRKCIENGNEEDAQRAMAYVDDVSVFLKRQKRQHDEAREVTSITETPPTAHEERNEAIKTKHEDCYEELTSYVERFRNPENKRINWRKCFDQGQIDQVEEIMKLGSSEDLRSKCKKSMSHSTRK